MYDIVRNPALEVKKAIVYFRVDGQINIYFKKLKKRQRKPAGYFVNINVVKILLFVKKY